MDIVCDWTNFVCNWTLFLKISNKWTLQFKLLLKLLFSNEKSQIIIIIDIAIYMHFCHYWGITLLCVWLLTFPLKKYAFFLEYSTEWFFWLVTLNSILNPWIYITLDAELQRSLAVSCCPRWKGILTLDFSTLLYLKLATF